MSQRSILIYNDLDDTVVAADGALPTDGYQTFTRSQDDNGVVKIDFHPNGGGPGTVSVSIQGRVSAPAPATQMVPEEPWVTITSVSEAELGVNGGTFFETITMFPYMRVQVSGNDDVLNRVLVWIME